MARLLILSQFASNTKAMAFSGISYMVKHTIALSTRFKLKVSLNVFERTCARKQNVF